jgi:hypothetical protein
MTSSRNSCLVLLVLLFAGISSAAAAGITLTASQSDFSVLAGNEAVIPIVSENTYDHDVPGTLIVYTSTLPDPPGLSTLPVNDSRTKTYTVFQGISHIFLPSGVSDVNATRVIRVVFSNDETGAGTVTLGPIIVHYLSGPSPVQAGGPSLQSTSEQKPVSAQPGGSSGNGPGNGASGQPSSGAGGSNAGGSSTSGPGSSAAAPAAYQAPAESGVLKSLVTQENEKAARIENNLTGKIAADHDVKSIDANLSSLGFTNTNKTFTQINQSSGHATWSYQAAGGRSATLSAGISDDEVREVAVSSDDPSIVPKNIAEDAAFRQSMSALEEKGYTPEKYTVSLGPDGQNVEVLYRNNQGRTARLAASLVNGTVVNTTSGEDFNPGSLFFPFLLALLPAGIALTHYYYQKKKKNVTVVPQAETATPGVPGYYATANNLLDSAESAYNEGRYPDACGQAARALRIFISGQYAGGIELTDEDIMLVVSGQSPDTISPEKDILALCSLVRFGKGTPSGDEFYSVIRRIRNLLK